MFLKMGVVISFTQGKELVMEKTGRAAGVFLALVFASFALMAQDGSEAKVTVFKGYLADKMCGSGFVKSGDSKIAAAKAKKHTVDCTMSDNCKASGYGLVVGNKYHKFDATGDKLALDYLTKTKKTDNLWVEVKGTADGDNITVASIEDVKPSTKKK
jgi:hypothetical protein